jgi:hypothetical protein
MFNLVNYLKTIFPNEWVIVDDVNIEWNGLDTTMIVRRIDGGANYGDSRTEPIQLVVYSTDLANTKSQMDLFVKEYNQKYVRRDLEDVVITLFPSVVIPQINTITSEYSYQLVTTGFLQISNDINDIKEVYIDNIKYSVISSNLNYVTILDSQNENAIMQNVISVVRNSQTKLALSIPFKKGLLFDKLRMLRKHNADIDTVFKVKVVYIDDETEEYNMKCDNHTITSERGRMANLNINFSE